MTDLAKLTALRDRVATLKGPDREVDEEILRVFSWREDDGGYGHHESWLPPSDWKITDSTGWPTIPWLWWRDVGSHSWGGFNTIPFTASLDAVDAFRERVLPEGFWSIERRGAERQEYIAALRLYAPSGGKAAWITEATTAPLAYLLAVLNGVIAKETP